MRDFSSASARYSPLTASAVPRSGAPRPPAPAGVSATVRSSFAPVDLAGEDQRAELRLVGLAVAVDTAVALLDADQRPRHVVVDQLVALAVQVDALGGHVTGEQDAYGGVGQAEVLDDTASAARRTARRASRAAASASALPLKPSAPGTASRSHSSVWTRSEKTTTRVSDFGPTPIAFNCSTSAANFAESVSVHRRTSARAAGAARPAPATRVGELLRHAAS